MFTPLQLEQTFMVEGQILNFCGPLFFSSSSNLIPANVVSNGSYGLIDTGALKVLVTCDHVIEEFKAYQQDAPDARMALLLGSGYPVSLSEAQLIDRDKQLDIATFRMEPLLSHCKNRQFYPLDKHPACSLKPRDILAFVGYVGECRSVVPEGVNFSYEAFGLSVSDVSRFQIVADLTKTRRTFDMHEAIAPPRQSLGGISGSPCFQVLRNNVLRLVAFATSDALGLVRLTHASCINADGTLIR